MVERPQMNLPRLGHRFRRSGELNLVLIPAYGALGAAPRSPLSVCDQGPFALGRDYVVSLALAVARAGQAVDRCARSPSLAILVRWMGCREFGPVFSGAAFTWPATFSPGA